MASLLLVAATSLAMRAEDQPATRARRRAAMERVPVARARLRRVLPRHAQDDEHAGRRSEPAPAIRFPSERRRRYRLHRRGVRILLPAKAPSPITDDFYVKLVNAYAKGSDSRSAQEGRGDHRRSLRASRRSLTATAARASSITWSMSCRPATASIMLVSAGPRATPRTTMPSASAIPSACSRDQSRSVSRRLRSSGAIELARLGRLRLAQILDEALHVL